MLKRYAPLLCIMLLQALNQMPLFAASNGAKPVLKAIDPSAAILDAPPPPEAQKPAVNTPIQGRPLNGLQPQTPMLDQLPQEPVNPADEERVSRLERQAFGSTYPEHEVPDRLEHLEKEVLGGSKGGQSVERIARLEQKLLGGSAFGGSPHQPPGNAYTAVPIGQGYPAPIAVLPPQPIQQPYQQPMQQSTPQQAPQQPLQQSPLQQPYQQPLQQSPLQQPYQQPLQQSPLQQPYQQPIQQQPAAHSPIATKHLPPGQVALPQNWNSQPNFSPRAYVQPKQNTAGPVPSPTPNYDVSSPPRSMGLTIDAAAVANSLNYDQGSGDYLSAIKRFNTASGAATYAHWLRFPVKVRLPAGSPESWQRNLEAVIARWDQYVPVKIALPNEPANVDVLWVNQLPPKALGVTRLGIAGGQMRVWVYLLRPSFYPNAIAERTLPLVFTREIGHALGLFGKSDKLSDLMYASDSGSSNTNAASPPVAGKAASVKFAPIGQRDINTLKRLYESPVVPPDLSLQQPLEWATSY